MKEGRVVSWRVLNYTSSLSKPLSALFPLASDKAEAIKAAQTRYDSVCGGVERVVSGSEVKSKGICQDSLLILLIILLFFPPRTTPYICGNQLLVENPLLD